MIGLLSRFLTSRLHYSIVSPSAFGGAFVPVTAPRFHSRVQVSICFPSRSSCSSRPVSAFPLLSLPQPDPQNASPECRGGETLDSQIIQSNNGGQFLSVARRVGALLRPPLSPFGIQTHYLPKPLPSLLMEAPEPLQPNRYAS